MPIHNQGSASVCRLFLRILLRDNGESLTSKVGRSSFELKLNIHRWYLHHSMFPPLQPASVTAPAGNDEPLNQRTQSLSSAPLNQTKPSF
jgi:hypothetical protein